MYDGVRVGLNGRHLLTVLLVFLVYMFTQGQKSAFAYSQSLLIASNNFSGLNSYFFMWINFAYYLVWGTSYIFAGPLCDIISPKVFILIGSWSFSATYVLLALVATYAVSNAFTIMTVFILVAIPGPWPWPCALSIINQWFHRDYLVPAIAIFVSCINAGPTLGTVVGKIMITNLNEPMMTPVYVYACCLATAGVFLFSFLKWSPNGQHNKNIDQDRDKKKQPDQKNQKRIDYISVFGIPNYTTYLISYMFIKCGQSAYLSFLQTLYNSVNVASPSNTSILTDMGSLAGGIVAGLLCYFFNRKSTIILIFLSIGTILIAIIYAQPLVSTSFGSYILLGFLVSFFYGGAYNMMTAMIPVVLSNQIYLRDYKYCTGTVVANYAGWGNYALAPNAIMVYYSALGGGLFFYSILLSLLSSVFLIRLTVKENKEHISIKKIEPTDITYTENDIIPA